jgi:exosortase
MTVVLRAIKFSSRFRPAYPLLFVSALIAGYWPTLLSLHERWSQFDESYAHGHILLALSLWLYIDDKPAPDRTAPLHTTPLQLACLSMLAAASLTWAVAALAGITVIQQILMPAILLFCIGAIADPVTLARALAPCCLLVLAIPIWEELLMSNLRNWSTHVPAWLVQQLFGIPVMIGQFEVHVPAGIFLIRGGCSGLGFLLSSATLGAAFGQLFLIGRRSRMACLLVAISLGILINWIRITALILIGQFTNMTSPLITEGHLMFGFYIFAAVSLVAILITTRLLPASAKKTYPPRATIESAATSTTRRTPFLLCAATLVALAAGPLLAAAVRVKDQNLANTKAPPVIGSILTLVEPAYADSGFRFATFDALYRYQNDPTLQVHVVYYADPFGHGKLVSTKNEVLPSGWQKLEQTAVQLPTLPATTVTIAADRTKQTFLLWSWYVLGNHVTANSGARLRLTQLKNALELQTAGMFVAISAPCVFEGCSYTDKVLARHAPQILDAVSHWNTALRQSQNLVAKEQQ